MIVRPLNLINAGYHKVVIMCDAECWMEVIIETLILTFFFRLYARIELKGGHVYIATTSLYLVKTRHQEKYAWNDKERDEIGR